MRAQKMSFRRSCPKDNDFSDSHMIGKSHIGEACPKRSLPPKGMILPPVLPHVSLKNHADTLFSDLVGQKGQIIFLSLYIIIKKIY